MLKRVIILLLVPGAKGRTFHQDGMWQRGRMPSLVRGMIDFHKLSV